MSMRNENLDFQPDGWDRSGEGTTEFHPDRVELPTGTVNTGDIRNENIEFQPDGRGRTGTGNTGAFRASNLEFQPDSWIRSGDAYRGSAEQFTTAAQQVLDSTTSLSGGGANPLDTAVNSILSEISARGTGVVSSISSSLGGIGAGMISTGMRYRNLEAEQTSTANGMPGGGS